MATHLAPLEQVGALRPWWTGDFIKQVDSVCYMLD